MTFLDFMFVPTILFLVVVMPLWLIMHYRHKSKMGQGITEKDRLALDDLLRSVDSLSDRIDALESILDDHNSRWREDTAKD